MSPINLTFLLGALLSTVPACRACSNFLLAADDMAAVSGRTMDLGFWDGFSVVAVPPGSVTPVHSNASAANKYGFLSIYPSIGVDQVRGLVKSSGAGMNTDGLSCDLQTLVGTEYPPYPKDPRTAVILVDRFCEWTLGSFSTVAELKAALSSSKVRVVGSDALWQNHFVVRDRLGRSLVVEFLQGETVLHEDLNDGSSGFGVFTNEPAFAWHLENVKHLEWKKTMARSAVAVPGGFYPDERYLRLHMLKQGLPAPASYKEKVMQAVHLLDSVTVPPGEQPATDSGTGEGDGDHTVFGLVYDHGLPSSSSSSSTSSSSSSSSSSLAEQGEDERQLEPVLYWRTYADQSLQRAALKDLPSLYQEGAKTTTLPLVNDLPWFQDAAAAFS